MSSATIILFLPDGDAKGLRTAEISNWTGKALAAPRTELDRLVAREECQKAGVYVLTGTHPQTNRPHAYIGEAEVISDRLKQHRGKEFWVSAIVFVSKDENLTKAHVRFLESRILAEATEAARFTVEQNQASGSKLPESDREDMEVFLTRVRQLLPVLGSDLLIPSAQVPVAVTAGPLICKVKGAVGRGQRTREGFVVFKGSTAALQERPSAQARHPFVVELRAQLVADGTLVRDGGFLRFARDHEFSSPSAAAAVLHGGGANGLTEWRSADGVKLKELETVDRR